MKTSDFDYSLPKSYIAQQPVDPRDSSRMMVISGRGGKVEHRRFYNLCDYLGDNDVIVVNKTKVIPARIIFYDGDKEREIFVLEDMGKNHYRAMVRPGRYFKRGKRFFSHGVECEVKNVLKDGTRIIGACGDIMNGGEIPLPPYIHNKDVDLTKYQTVYAENNGSVAAPTAGLHFTPELISKLKERGVRFEKVLLHVGRGTFLPIREENIEDHEMHSEYFELDRGTADRLNEYKREGKRIIAVGTTTVRVLESSYDDEVGFLPFEGETKIFIYPGYKWKSVDSLITNFHLPKSTLLLLVSSFLGSSKKLLELYETAKQRGYRFYSFGDCMFLI